MTFRFCHLIARKPPSAGTSGGRSRRGSGGGAPPLPRNPQDKNQDKKDNIPRGSRANGTPQQQKQGMEHPSSPDCPTSDPFPQKYVDTILLSANQGLSKGLSLNSLLHSARGSYVKGIDNLPGLESPFEPIPLEDILSGRSSSNFTVSKTIDIIPVLRDLFSA